VEHADGNQSLEMVILSTPLARFSNQFAWETCLTQVGARRLKTLANERWKRSRKLNAATPYCWVFTDYDERTITY
jgi:hypothetical protein